MRWWNSTALLSDGMAAGALALGVVALVTGQALTPGSLFAMGAGMAVVSIAWRINTWALNRYHRGDWPFEPGRPFWRRRTRT